MKFSKLGNTNIKISKIGLGTMTFGEQNSEVESFLQIPLTPFLDTLENDMDPEHNSIQEMYLFTFEKNLIWGASARMLKQINSLLKEKPL